MKSVLLLTHVESPAFKAIKEGLLPLAKEREWAMHVFTPKTFAEASSLVKAWDPDGCIAYAAPPSGLSGNFKAWRRPVVAINAPHPIHGMACIAHDSAATGALAARELVSLGIDNFAFYSTDMRLPWVETRFKSFAAEIESRGRRTSRYEGRHLGKWLSSLPKPCGVFAANDVAAERVAAEAFACGIAIPRDIALVGCDDDPQICEHSETTISSIRMDFFRCAKLAVEALECSMEGRPCKGETLYGDIGVTRRISTHRIAGHPADVSSLLEYIRLNALSGITAEDVANQFRGSRRTVEYKMRKATGRSILEEIQDVRLAEAKRLLANPLVKIGSIASRVGYDSENFFARVFKRTVGVTMREYRSRAPVLV